MLGNDVIEQRNRAGMQSQRIFNRLRKLDHVPSHDIAHSAGKPSHVVVIVRYRRTPVSQKTREGTRPSLVAGNR